MKIKTSIVGIISILFLLSSSILVTSQDGPDPTKIGVSSGDSFHFVMEIILTDPSVLSGWPFINDLVTGDQIRLQDSDAAELILSDDFNQQISEDNNQREVSWRIGSKTYRTLISLDSYFGSGYIIYTDWEYWETQVKLELSDFSTTYDSSPENFSYSVLNEETEFKVQFNVSRNRSGIGSGYALTQWVWEKNNGVLLYEHWLTLWIWDGYQLNDPETDIEEFTFRRKDYTFIDSIEISDSPSILGGFDGLLTIMILIPIALIIRKKI